MIALRAHFDGKVLIPDEPIDLPCGQSLVVHVEEAEGAMVNTSPPLTGQTLLDSGLVGLWRERTDIGDSSDYARVLRQQAQHR